MYIPTLRLSHFTVIFAVIVAFSLALPAAAQTDCNDGNGDLDTAEPKSISSQQIVEKFGAGEDRVRDARAHYSFTQDVLIQTMNGKSVDGQFHEITEVSFDEKGHRVDKVTFHEDPTLRGITITPDDMQDIHDFMGWVLTKDEASQYKFTYAGQQHVDDLDTYQFHLEPLRIEKNRRYFQGRIWVDNRDFQLVKLCGKSVPEPVQKKKKKKDQPVEIRPTFVGYRQLVDGVWFPAYARVDDTLQVGVDSVHIREIVKFTNYKKTGDAKGTAHP